MTQKSETTAEIEEARGQFNATRRATSPEMEEILLQAFPILDHGVVRVVDYLGNDNAIVQAARVSYGNGTKKMSDDAALIRYLMRHRHSTPFEMCEIKLHVKLPIFVARQWVRHRTASINEISARYSILDKEFYIPQVEHMAVQSKTNRQGRGNLLVGDDLETAMQILNESSNNAYDFYEALLKDDKPEEDGLARELSRMVLPTNYYTQWYWKTNLHNLFHFLSLRADTHAQYEIRVYAEKICEIVKKWCPIAYQAFVDYRLEAKSFSGPEMKALHAKLAGKEIARSDFGMSQREWDEFLKKIQ